MSVNRVNRGYSPIPFDRYEVIKSGLKPGEYVVMNQLPPQNALAPYQPPHHYFRNALMLGGLGAGLGAIYHFRNPIMKLGQKAINYATDKFHNLFSSTQSANKTATLPNPHNW